MQKYVSVNFPASAHFGSLAAICLFTTAFTTAASAEDHFNIGDEAPSFRLKTVNAELSKMSTVALDDYVGSDVPEGSTKKKVLMLSFWASYCEPCKREMPFLSTLYKEYGDKGLFVTSISIDKDEAALKKVDEIVAVAKGHQPVGF